MPRLRVAVSNEILLGAGVHHLDPGLRLNASQAGLLLNRSKTRMDTDRRDNKPPLAGKDQGKLFYTLGAVLEERARQEGMSLGQVAREKADQQRGWPTFSAFIDRGGLRDTWPIALLAGRPVNALTSLGEPVSAIADMTLGEYLSARLQSAMDDDRSDQHASLENAILCPTTDRRPLRP